MTEALPNNSTVTVCKSLWKRAPWWRFSIMSSLLFTLIFVLFPPALNTMDQAKEQSLPEQATYSPVPKEQENLPSLHPSAVVDEQSPAISSDSRKALNQTQAQKHAKPRAAEISLASSNDNNSSQNSSGVDIALLGRTYSGSIPINGFRLPIPPGNWAMLANSSIKTQTATGMAYYFGRIEHKRVVGIIKAFAVRSNEKPGAGFAVSACKKDNPNDHYQFIDAHIPNDHEACWFIDSYYTTPWQSWADRAINLISLDRAAAGDMAAKGVTYPQDFVGVRFERAEKWGLLEVTFMFSPDSEGIASNAALSYKEADWYVVNIVRYPEKKAYVAKLKNWGTSFWPKFQTAFAEGE